MGSTPGSASAPRPFAPLLPEAFDIDRLRSAATGRRIVVGVTGGIAAYKAAVIVSRLAQVGAHVTVAMNKSAQRFVTPLTFQALSANAVLTSPWQQLESKDPQHIRLASGAALCIVAPCTMNTMAKLAHGLANDTVSLVLSAIHRGATPVLLAPSMNAAMWAQPSTQRNLATLHGDGFRFIGPESGWQACRTVGAGRMSEPETILAAATQLLEATPRP